MRFVSTKLTNFRNIADVSIDFNDKNFLIGANAQGKTNILEALHYLSLGKSFKTIQEQWLIKIGESAARIEGVFVADNGEEQNISVVLQNTEMGLIKTFQINQTKTSKKEFLKHIPSIIFTPDEVGLIKIQSLARRALMNNILTKTQITYLDDLSTYNKILKQRNQLLFLIKQNRVDIEELEGWDSRLAELGCKIIAARKNLIIELNKSIGDFFNQLSGEENSLKLAYINHSQIESSENYLIKLKNNRELDIKLTHTSFGPHRDDLQFLLNNQDAIQLASQGQFRLIVLALKLAKGEYLKNILQETPIYLMDDVFSELDAEKIDYIHNLFENNQSIFTTTNQNLVTNHKTKQFLVKAGSVKELITNELAQIK